MTKRFFKIIFLFIIIQFFVGGFSYAADVPDTSPANLSYIFHLYYDTGQLFADRDFQYKYDLLPQVFTPETIATNFPYKGEVVDLKNQIAKTFQFDPRQGNPNFLKGKINVSAPYVPDGQKVVFYNAQDQQLLTVYVSESSICNDDNVCDQARGENSLTCPNDCKNVAPIDYSNQFQQGQPNPMVWYVAGGVLAVLVFIGWLIWRKWKKTKEKEELRLSNPPQMNNKPPEPPSPTIPPTPPTPNS